MSVEVKASHRRRACARVAALIAALGEELTMPHAHSEPAGDCLRGGGVAEQAAAPRQPPAR